VHIHWKYKLHMSISLDNSPKYLVLEKQLFLKCTTLKSSCEANQSGQNYMSVQAFPTVLELIMHEIFIVQENS
jgi:hypothetical protein